MQTNIKTNNSRLAANKKTYRFTVSPVAGTPLSVVSKYTYTADGVRLEWFLGLNDNGQAYWWCAARLWKGGSCASKPATADELDAIDAIDIFFLNPADPVPSITIGYTLPAEAVEATEEELHQLRNAEEAARAFRLYGVHY